MNARFQSVGKLANGVHEVYAVFDVYVRSVLVYLYLYHNFYAAVILKLDSLSYKAKVGTAAVLAMLELCCGEPNQNWSYTPNAIDSRQCIGLTFIFCSLWSHINVYILWDNSVATNQ